MDSIAYLEELTERYPKLKLVETEIGEAARTLVNCYLDGHKVLICGNGGSSSDSDHIAGELMKGFEQKRPINEILKKQLISVSGERGGYLSEKLQQGLPAISLTAHTGLITAVSNDTDACLIYAQQVIGYGQPGDILIGITTSGNSQSVLDAIIAAKAIGLKVIGMTGETGGRIKPFCDILINVPERRTSFVQELHLPVYHTLCLIVENHFFGNTQG
jgi:D-sedoheptulose 7-phosphate isomerase